MEEFSIEEVIKMAEEWATKQFTEVLYDYNKEEEFFENYSFRIIVAKEE